MHTRSMIIAVLLAFTVTMPLTGCGDGNDNNGNDNEGGGPNPTATPVAGRTATPVVTATSAVATVTATTGGPTPTAAATAVGPTVTPTPVAGACQAGDQLVVTASLDKTYAGAAIVLTYPPAANIPGTDNDASVKDRIVFAPGGGITTASDNDENPSDGVDDTIRASFASSDDQTPGLFITVTFDCVAGQAPPAASAFTCEVGSASTSAGDSIDDLNCSVSLQ